MPFCQAKWCGFFDDRYLQKKKSTDDRRHLKIERPLLSQA